MYSDKFFVKLRSQYLFWFIRNELLTQEMEREEAKLNSLDPKKSYPAQYQRKLSEHTLQIEGLLRATERPERGQGKYGMPYVLQKLTNMNERTDWEELMKKALSGSRQFGASHVNLMDSELAGVRNAFENGPYHLFNVMYAESLFHASSALKESIVAALDSIHAKYSHIKDEVKHVLEISGITAIFGGGLKMMDGLDQAINLLFPKNEWRSFQYPMDVTDSSKKVSEIPGIEKQILPLRSAAPILLSYAYIRACYFGEDNYLANICYKAKVLQILRSEYLINNKGWFVKDNTVKNEKLSLSGWQIRKAFQNVKTFGPLPFFAHSLVSPD